MQIGPKGILVVWREHFRGGGRAMVWVVILIQRTSESLIIEEPRESKGSDFDTAHERELGY